MKFRTIIITKKKIILTAAVTGIIGLATGGIAFIVHSSSESIPTFNEQSIYETILEEGLPKAEKKEVNIKNIVKNIIGFDTDNPESIIQGYSSVFEDVQAHNEELPEDIQEEWEEWQDNETEIPEFEYGEKTDLPDKSQIYNSTGILVNNGSKYTVNADELCSEDLTFEIDNDGPQVLIVHTHTTECFVGDEMPSETERSTDPSCNIIAIGDIIGNILEEYGIETIHDTTFHDYPTYQGAYTRALTTTNSILEQYPSIKIVLDVHRDAYIYTDGRRLKVTSEQNGINTAQVMLVVGTDSMGLSHANWKENLKFAAKIQNAAEIMYPGLMRPINLRNERFNGHTSLGSLILEVGSNGNTLDEAKEGGKCVAHAIAAVLTAQ